MILKFSIIDELFTELMKKLLPVFALFTFLSISSFSQELTSIGPWDLYYTTDLTFGKNDRVFASTNGGLYFSDDLGTSWLKSKAPFNSVYFESPVMRANNGDVYTWFDRWIYHSTDNGETWIGQIVTIPENDKISSLGVFGDTVLVGSDMGLYYYSSSEFLVESNKFADFTGFHITEIRVLGDKMLVGTKHDGLYLSDDRGNIWKKITTGFPANFEVTCLDVLGDKIFVGSQWNGVYYTEDWGVNWNTKNAGFTSMNVTDLYIEKDKMHVTTDSYQNIYSSSVDGSSWNLIDNGIDNRYSPQAILAKGNSLLVGAWHGVLGSTNSGTSWEIKMDGIRAAFDFTSIQLSQDGSLFAFATHTGLYRKKPSDTMFYPFVKTDGGRIGKGAISNNRVPLIDANVIKFYNAVTGILEDQILTPNMNFTDVLVSTKEGFFISTLSNGIYHYNINNSWDAFNTNLSSTEVNDLIIADSILYVGTKNGLYKSRIENDNWKKVEINQSDLDVQNIYNHDSVFIVSTMYYSYRSSDYGVTWSKIATLDNQEIKEVILDNNRLYTSSYSTIYYSDDMGITWLKASEYPNKYFRAMTIQNNILYLSAIEEGIFSTQINREQAIEFDLPESSVFTNTPAFAIDATSSSGLPVSLNSSDTKVVKLNENQLTIVGVGQADIIASQSGNMYYRPAPEVKHTVTVEEVITATEKSNDQLVGVYSNPGNGFFNVKLNNTLTTTEYSLEVIDALGKTIDYSIEPIDRTSFILDIHGAPNGIYILNVRNERYSTHIRFIKQ